MDPLISDLLSRYETGRLSRRDLVAGLSALAATGIVGTGAAAQSQATQAPAPIIPTGLGHVSILVSDLQRSVDFYGRVFGMVVASEDVENKIARLSPPATSDAPEDQPSLRTSLVSLREEPPAGLVDHWCFRVPDFNPDAATAVLAEHRLTPATNLEFGFHVRDPDGVVVQMA
jgi:catechol 2,3-dioxygenase-like lactoylglutathione lyase family enzyme